MAGKYFGIPFALSGDRTAIPDAAQPDGSVSFTQGFTLDYELENTDPNYKPVPREETNALYYDITEAVGIVQKQGFADWTIAAAPYPINAFVRHNDIVWRNTAAGNSAEPSTDATWLNTATPTSILPIGYFSGFSLANDGAAPNTTISVAAGSARSSDNTVDINLANSLRGILQSSGSWAAGDNQNKLDTGARANNTWYHVFAIRKTSDGTADILFSTSVSAPVMPSGYAGFVLIESILTDGSGNILPFVNVGRAMTWKTARQDVNLSVVAPGNTTVTISTPPGRRVMAKQYGAVNGDACTLYTHSPDVNNETLNFPGGGWKAGISTNNTGLSNESVAGYLECVTGVNSDIVLQLYAAAASLNTAQLAVMGWEKI